MTKRPLTPAQKAALEKGRRSTGTAKTARATATSAAQRAKDQELAETADPDRVILEMQVQSGLAAIRGLRRFNAGGEPSKLLIDVVREARQLSVEARSILIERGHANRADSFLDEVAERMSRANFGVCPHCGEPPIKPVATDA